MRYFFISVLTIAFACLCLKNADAQDEILQNLLEQQRYHQAIDYIKAGKSFEIIETDKLEVLGFCYIMTRNYITAEEVYKELVNRRQPRAESILYYAEILKINGKYSEAKEYFRRYRRLNPDDRITNVKIASCDSLKVWQYLETDLKVLPIYEINTEMNETSAVEINGGILFLSDVFNIGSDHIFAEDPIMQTYFYDGKDIIQHRPWISEKYYFTSISFNKTTSTLAYSLRLIIKLDDQIVLGNSRIFFDFPESKSIDDLIEFTWEGMPENINLSHPCLTQNGNRIYFASDMPGGKGGMDLYYSDLINEKWSKPINLGNNINTEFNELSPFVDENILYFSSDGHPGYGNMDVFYSLIDGDEYSDPVNLKAPVNSIGDDFFFRSKTTGDNFLVTSNRSSMSAGGHDIFELKPIEPEIIEPEIIAAVQEEDKKEEEEVPEEIKEKVVEVVEIIEKDEFEEEVIVETEVTTEEYFEEEIIEIEEKIITEIITEKEVFDEISEVEVIEKYEFEEEKSVETEVTSEEYFEEEIIEIEEKIITEITTEKEVFDEISEVEIPESVSIDFRHHRLPFLLFETNRTNIHPNYNEALKSLADTLKNNPNMKVKLFGYTDITGCPEHNKTLSVRRAKTVAEKLIELGVSSAQITYKGQGESTLTEIEDVFRYHVVVGALRRSTGIDHYENLLDNKFDISVIRFGRVFRYYTGNYENIEEAELLANYIRQEYDPKAYVIRTYFGTIVSVYELAINRRVDIKLTK